MLESLPFEGTMKVRNKGVDIAIIANTETVSEAFAASRQLVVCGISTAVLEATCLDPIDTRTLEYYEKTTLCLLAMTESVYDAVRLVIAPDTRLVLFAGSSASELVITVREVLRKGK